MTKRFAFVPGDGVGVEVADEAITLLEAVARREGFAAEIDRYDYGAQRYLDTGETLPPGALEELAAHDAIFMGAFGDPRVPDMRHARDILLGTRFELDLFVNLRPVRCLHDRLCPLRGRTAADIDFVVFRENTEGIYVGMGGIFKKGTPDEVAVQEDVNTRKGVERIIRAAFEYAASHGRGRVTMSDKSNAMRYAHDIWQRVFREVAEEYPSIEADHLYIDALAMALIRDPRPFEVIVTCNLFGDIVTDLGAQLQGGMGVAASGNTRPSGCSMFEPVHGSAPDIAGQGKANPIAAALTVAMMLDHVGLGDASSRIESAVAAALDDGACTPDVGGTLGTAAAGAAIVERLDAPRGGD